MIHSDTQTIDHAAHGRLGAGAKSPAGLAASARNATKHGLTARTFCLLHNEDADLFHQLQANLMASLTPRNALELIHVERIIESTWLLYRAADLERNVLAAEVEVQRMLHEKQFAHFTSPAQIELREASLTFFALESLDSSNKVFANLTRYRTTHERSLHRAQNALAKMRGGATALATNIWPELPLPFQPTDQHHFRAPQLSPIPEQTAEPIAEQNAILQNEAPNPELATPDLPSNPDPEDTLPEPNSEFCETKPPSNQDTPANHAENNTEPSAEPTPEAIDCTPRE